MEILIGTGLENILFGMSIDDIKFIMGNPDKTYTIDIAKGNRSIFYIYNSKMIKLEFNQDVGYNLCSIETCNPEVEVFGHKIFNKTEKETEVLLNQFGYADFESDNYDTFDSIYCEKINLNIEFEFGRLRCVNFGPLFNNDDLKWPKQTQNIKSIVKVKNGIGIDQIVFGIKMKDAIAIWGKPDKITEEIKDAVVYYYFSKKAKLKFCKLQQSRLYSIEICNQDLLMLNQNVYMKTRSEISDLLKKSSFKSDYKDYNDFETLFCTDIWTTFIFKYNRVVGVEFSPLNKRNGLWQWPK